MEKQIVKFLDQVRSLGDSGKIASEYSAIRSQTDAKRQSAGLTTDAGALRDNMKKNRYRDILPYDQSRVVLTDSCGSDYINASFIQGAVRERLYIATQGPLSNTVSDFWRMVWQYEVKVIIMACKETEMGKRKCERYWPAYMQTDTFGSFVISNLNESYQNEEVTVRTLVVKHQSETRDLSQFQYVAWPDHGIPCTSEGILHMLEMVHSVQANSSSPILVHCSAGCGRTGVICTVDYINDLLRAKRITEDFNIMDIVLQMRSQRPSAVQTMEQYEFLYRIVQQMFQKALLCSANNNHNLTEQPQNNVGVVNYKEKPAAAFRISSSETIRKPEIRPRTSSPRVQNMNDTYAVVNKPKQRPAASSAHSSLDVHHYDKERLADPSSAAMPLYSAVKPKNRPAGRPLQSDRSPAAAPRTEKGRSLDQGHYEFVSGVFRTRSCNPTFVDSSNEASTARRHSTTLSSTDDDYEYVTPPVVTRMTSQDGGMGFNLRVKKPKGPRDPPAHWSRAER